MKKFIVMLMVTLSTASFAEQDILDQNKKLIGELTEMVTRKTSEAPDKELIQKQERLIERGNLQIEYLKKLEKNLEALNTTLDRKMKDMSAQQASMNETILAERQLQNQKAQRIAGVYENMQPQKAGAVIKDMDEKMATTILQKINQRQAGKILETLPPSLSLRYTKMILSWSAKTPSDAKVSH